MIILSRIKKLVSKKEMNLDDAEKEKSIEEALDSVFVYGGGDLSENDRGVIREHLEGYLSGEK